MDRPKASVWRQALAACGAVAALAVLLAAIVALIGARPSSPMVPHPGYAGIRLGMSELQVEALLGGPRGVYDPSISFLKVSTGVSFGPSGHIGYWHFKGHRVIVTFDAAGRVTAKQVGPPEMAGTAAWAWRWCADTVAAWWPEP